MTTELQERINEARESVSHPGKFEGESPITPILWELVLDSCADEEAGDSTDGPEFVARVGRWLVSESTYGFVSSCRYETVEAAERAFATFDAEYAAWTTEDEEPEEDEAAPETGPCDSCQALMINGIRCHETGCPRARRN